MIHRKTPFRKIDVARAVNAVQGAGLTVARVEIDQDGKIVIVTTADASTGDDTDREIEAWRREKPLREAEWLKNEAKWAQQQEARRVRKQAHQQEAARQKPNGK